MSDKELVRKLYIDLCEASINKDLIKLGEILSDDYVLVHMIGMKQTKEDYLDSKNLITINTYVSNTGLK